mmetsp:Transcript_63533/g.143310  ORF Transcript_63533/g.143310 Transcript_63533/m.143310 type:complete len:84 (+) Transcript_63533:157-408(+)
MFLRARWLQTPPSKRGAQSRDAPWDMSKERERRLGAVDPSPCRGTGGLRLTGSHEAGALKAGVGLGKMVMGGRGPLGSWALDL